MSDKLYISSSMSYKPNFAKDKFRKARDILESKGYEVLSPVDLDDEIDVDDPDHFDYIREDLKLILTQDADGVVVFADHFLSSGSVDERYFGVVTGLPSYELDLETGELTEYEDLPALFSAKQKVYRSRRAQYGTPYQNLTHTAKIVNGILSGKLRDECKIDVRDISSIMMATKISRLYSSYKKDSVDDIAGYAQCLELAVKEAEYRGEDLEDVMAPNSQYSEGDVCDGVEKERKDED